MWPKKSGGIGKSNRRAFGQNKKKTLGEKAGSRKKSIWSGRKTPDIGRTKKNIGDSFATLTVVSMDKIRKICYKETTEKF